MDADADGVILFIQNEDSANRVYGVRELTSGDISLRMRNHRSRMHVVGLNAAKKFEAFLEASSTIKIYLVGQTKGSVVYYTNNVAVTDPTTGSCTQPPTIHPECTSTQATFPVEHPVWWREGDLQRARRS